jgi:hypothetical protein
MSRFLPMGVGDLRLYRSMSASMAFGESPPRAIGTGLAPRACSQKLWDKWKIRTKPVIFVQNTLVSLKNPAILTPFFHRPRTATPDCGGPAAARPKSRFLWRKEFINKALRSDSARLADRLFHVKQNKNNVKIANFHRK